MSEQTPDPANDMDPALPDRRIIEVRYELAAVVDEALAALVEGAPDKLFTRGRSLVRVLYGLPSRPGFKRDQGAPSIDVVVAPTLRDLLDRVACWQRRDRNATLCPTLPPQWVVDTLLERGEWPLRELIGIIETPTLRPDGSLLSKSGYDPATGLLLVPTTEFLPLAEHPTFEDARAAVEELLDPFCDFPFSGDESRAALVAFILTMVGRAAIEGPVPFFGVSASAPGSGKGLLVDVAALIGVGRRPALMAYTESKEEMRKRILAVALGGDPLVALDNATTIGSDVLAAALTTTTWQDRILGVSKVAKAPLRAVWCATGNNLRYSQTLGRRVIPIDLHPPGENPEDRSDFRYAPLIDHVRSARPRLLRAALTILRAFDSARRPQHGKPKMGSYEDWDAWVRAACIWCGVGDPAGTDDATQGRGRVRAEADEDLEAIQALHFALLQAFGETRFTAAQVALRARQDEPFRDAILGLRPERETVVRARNAGAVLKDVRDRIVRGCRVVRVGSARGGVAVWCVMVTHPEGGPAATAGAPCADRAPGESPRLTADGTCQICGRTELEPGAALCVAHLMTEDVKP